VFQIGFTLKAGERLVARERFVPFTRPPLTFGELLWGETFSDGVTKPSETNLLLAAI
jgi:hypothetical protein